MGYLAEPVYEIKSVAFTNEKARDNQSQFTQFCEDMYVHIWMCGVRERYECVALFAETGRKYLTVCD
ncbi:hypothetical protein ACHQM5_015856 [Ranunculus cassubicifolius]